MLTLAPTHKTDEQVANLAASGASGLARHYQAVNQDRKTTRLKSELAAQSCLPVSVKTTPDAPLFDEWRG